MYSLIVPIYNNEQSLPALLSEIGKLNKSLDNKLEAVFVVDGSPDNSFSSLKNSLSDQSFNSRLVLLSRNFGSFTAIRSGLKLAKGPYFAVMAADLQEPPELILEFFRVLETEPFEVTVGVREGREDPWLAKMLSGTFWFLYRNLVQTEMPAGGVDIFGCNLAVRDQLLTLNESNTSLVGLIFWLGYRRKMIGYTRLERKNGSSGWSFRKRFSYLVDSFLAFSDLPIWILLIIGALGLGISLIFGIIIICMHYMVGAAIPGYAATMLVILSFGALNCFGLGIIGSYVWRIFENTKGRPQGIVLTVAEYEAIKQ